MNKVIICIPTYNRTECLNSLLKNLENQSDQNFSLVVLNDGDNQKTKKVLETKNPKFYFHFFESEKPSGLPGARNKILDYIEKNKLADGKNFVAFLDDDLIIENDFVFQIKKYSERFDGFCFRIIQRGQSTTFDLVNSNFLQKIFKPFVGRIVPFLGIFFSGFYIKLNKIKKVDHINGGCMIYNFSKNRTARFDMNLNEGNFVAEDTCFSYGLKRKGNDLRFISDYSYIHNPPETGGCKISNKQESFYWYWKHKIYIFKKYHGKFILFFVILFSFIESIALSAIFKTNLLNKFFRALK